MAVWLKTRLPVAILMNHNVCFVMDSLNQAGLTWVPGKAASPLLMGWGPLGTAPCPPGKGAGERIQAQEGENQSGVFSVPRLETVGIIEKNNQEQQLLDNGSKLG